MSVLLDPFNVRDMLLKMAVQKTHLLPTDKTVLPEVQRNCIPPGLTESVAKRTNGNINRPTILIATDLAAYHRYLLRRI